MGSRFLPWTCSSIFYGVGKIATASRRTHLFHDSRNRQTVTRNVLMIACSLPECPWEASRPIDLEEVDKHSQNHFFAPNHLHLVLGQVGGQGMRTPISMWLRALEPSWFALCKALDGSHVNILEHGDSWLNTHSLDDNS